jgi:FixJ family two-component response regulator
MIYVVEDDDAVRDSFRLILEARGFKVCDFSDSYSLFAYGVRKSASCFILDVNLPDESVKIIFSSL